MTKKELYKLMENVPDYAVIFVESDHGQTPEMAYHVDISSTPEKYWDGDELDWRGNEKAITAVRIS